MRNRRAIGSRRQRPRRPAFGRGLDQHRQPPPAANVIRLHMSLDDAT
jgi:hypothetical protein